MMYIISVVLGTAVFLLVGVILRPVYVEIRDLLRGVLYLIGIDTFSRKDKIALGWEKDKMAPPLEIKGKIISNCTLSKENFPNIEEYFPNYQEYEVEEEEEKEESTEANIFQGMTYRKQLKLIESFSQKRLEGTLDSIEEAQFKILSDPTNLESSREQEAHLRRIKKR